MPTVRRGLAALGTLFLAVCSAQVANAACTVNSSTTLTLASPSYTYPAGGGGSGVTVTFTASYNTTATGGGCLDETVTITPSSTGGSFTGSTCSSIALNSIPNGSNKISTAICTATWTEPASPAASYTISATASSTPLTAFNISTSNTLTYNRTATSDMSVSLSSLPTSATVGAAYSGTVVCTNAAGGAAATSATCSVSGLPAGLTLGTCSPSAPVASLAAGSSITCPVSGTPTTAGNATVTGATGASNDVTTGNNSTTASISVGKGNQTVAFTSTAPSGATVGGATYTPAATATSGLTVALTVDAASASVCSMSGGVVSFLAAGSCVIDANQAGNANYNGAPQVQQTITVGKGNQTVAFTSTAPSGATVGGATYTPAATATSGLTVALTVDAASASVCSMSGGVVSFLAAGSCVIDANQAGNANYNGAPQVQQTITVGKGNQTVAFTSTAPSGATVGGATYTPAATATSGLTVALTVDAASASVCSMSGGVVSFLAAGSCVIDANQAGNANYNGAPQVQQTITVGKGNQTVAFTSTAPSGATVGGATYTPAATATSGLTVALTVDAASASVCSMSGGVVSFLAAGSCVIDANQAGNANYNGAPQVQQTFAVSKATTTAALSSSANPTLVGQPVTFTASVTPTAAAGSVTFKDGAATLGTGTLAGGIATFATTGLSSGSHSVTAVYGGNASYATSTSPVLAQNITANGTIALRVVTTDGDGTVTFSSSTPALSVSITTNGGSGQTTAISLNPGTYTVTASLPSGFGLTGVNCSDSDSSASVANHSATIVLAPAEAVTCTFSAANSRKKTVEVIQSFLSRRNDMLLSNEPDGTRQIDRLRAFGEAGGAGVRSREPASLAAQLRRAVCSVIVPPGRSAHSVQGRRWQSLSSNGCSGRTTAWTKGPNR